MLLGLNFLGQMLPIGVEAWAAFFFLRQTEAMASLYVRPFQGASIFFASKVQRHNVHQPGVFKNFRRAIKTFPSDPQMKSGAGKHPFRVSKPIEKTKFLKTVKFRVK